MSSKIRISIFTEAIIEGGGPMGYVYNMSKGFSKEELKYIKFYHYYNWNIKMPKFHIFQFILKCYLFLWRRINERRILSACKKSDICFFQGYQTSKYIEIAKKNNRFCLYMPHSPYIAADEIKKVHEMKGEIFSEDKYQEIYKNEDTLFKLSDAIVFATRNAANAYYNEWSKYLEKKKVYFLKSGVIVRKANDSIHLLDKYSDKIKIGFIGRYVEHKGYKLFCECATKFSDKEECVFITAGTGPLKDYDGCKNIIDLGFVKDIGNLIKDLDLIIIANTIAYYDLLPIECASYGKPLVMSYVGGNIDQLEDFKDSISFESGNIESLLESLSIAVNKIKINKSWGIQNQSIYQDMFTQQKMCKRWIELFNCILGEKKYI